MFDQYVQSAGLTQYAPLGKLHEAASSICGMYADGEPFSDVLSILLHNGWDAGDAGKLNGASVAAYCPQYENKTP